jgi:hypothetical protein
MTDFTPAQIAQLADDYARAKAAADAANETLAKLKKQIDDSGRAELVGKTFRLDVSIFERATLNPTAAKKFLTEEQVKTCTTISTVRRIDIKAAVEVTVKVA